MTTTTTGCDHADVRSKTVPYTGPVVDGDDENPVAHGNVCIVETCRTCGATRRTNSNAGQHEQGDWIPE